MYEEQIWQNAFRLERRDQATNCLIINATMRLGFNNFKTLYKVMGQSHAFYWPSCIPNSQRDGGGIENRMGGDRKNVNHLIMYLLQHIVANPGNMVVAYTKIMKWLCACDECL